MDAYTARLVAYLMEEGGAAYRAAARVCLGVSYAVMKQVVMWAIAQGVVTERKRLLVLTAAPNAKPRVVRRRAPNGCFEDRRMTIVKHLLQRPSVTVVEAAHLLAVDGQIARQTLRRMVKESTLVCAEEVVAGKGGRPPYVYRLNAHP